MREDREHPRVPVTMRQVAERAGVSPKTVSDILNGVGSFRDSTHERVRQAVDDLGYRRNRAARSLRSGRTGAYTLAVPELRLPYFAQLASAVVEQARFAGMEILVEPTDGTRESEIALLRSDRLRRTDGMIFAPLALSRDDGMLLPADVPTVVLGDRMRGGPVDSVGPSNLDAAAGAVRHLLDIGRTRIAVVGAHGASPHGTAAVRLRGVREELAAAGLRLEPALIVDRMIWHRRDGAAAAEELLERQVPFDGLVAFNDMLAVGVLHVLGRVGVRVPDDVAVVGFDGSPEGPFTAPPLTTIDLGIADVARAALAALRERVDGTVTGAGRDLLTDWRLVPRASTTGKAPGVAR